MLNSESRLEVDVRVMLLPAEFPVEMTMMPKAAIAKQLHSPILSPLTPPLLLQKLK